MGDSHSSRGQAEESSNVQAESHDPTLGSSETETGEPGKQGSEGESVDRESVVINDELMEMFNELKTDVDTIKTQLASMENDDTKQELFERLYNELDQHRRDFMYTYILKPLFKDLIALYDRVEKTADYFEVEEPQDSQMTTNIRSFQNEILDILRKQGVSSVEVDTNDFDERYQEAVDVESVDEGEADYKVLRTVRQGFMYEDKLIRPEEVVVGRYRQGGDDQDG